MKRVRRERDQRVLVRGGSPQRFPWTARLVRLLGKRSDAQVARIGGLSVAATRNERLRRRIPASGAREVFRWTKAALRLLGTASDAEVAKAIGLSVSTVSIKRRSLGIRSSEEVRPSPYHYQWTESSERLLGQISDAALARRLGISIPTVRVRRKALGFHLSHLGQGSLGARRC